MSVSLSRRQFVTASAAVLAAASWKHASAADVEPRVADGLAWYDVTQWGVEGRGWDDTARYFDRLPSRAEGRVRGAVWNLSRHSAGMLVRFETDATAIHARYRLLSNRLSMLHMPATGVSGLDLYARDVQGHDRWLAVARPDAVDVDFQLASGIDHLPGNSPRLYTIYLPLYNGVESLEIGIPEGNSFIPIAPRTERPVVFYGTSIMHGACASRPGMSISAILGRRLNLPTINLGFSGNGQMEAEVGEFLCELDPAVYVIDCLPNLQGNQVAERAEPLVRQLREARAETPILLAEDRTYAHAPFRSAARQRHTASRAALQQAYENLQAAGVQNLYYLAGDAFLGSDGEGTTDGSHPNDLGMLRYAEAYEPALRRALGST